MLRLILVYNIIYSIFIQPLCNIAANNTYRIAKRANKNLCLKRVFCPLNGNTSQDVLSRSNTTDLWQFIDGQDSLAREILMKKFLLNMMRQLIHDSMNKRIASEHIKDFQFQNNSISFGMGDISYKVRQKYWRMVFIYRRALRLQDNLTVIKFMDFLVETDFLGAEVNELVRMAEIWLDPKRPMTTGKKKTKNITSTSQSANILRMIKDGMRNNKWKNPKINYKYIPKIRAQEKRDVGAGFDSDQN